MITKRLHRHFYFPLILTLVLLTASCESQTDSSVQGQGISIAETRSWDISPSYVGGNITVAMAVADTLIMIDVSNRTIARVDSIGYKDNIHPMQISMHGDGPAEYRYPVALTITPGGDVAFTDAANQNITVMSLSGKYVTQVTLSEGGGKRFAFVDGSRIAVQSLWEKRIALYDLSDHSVQEYHSMPPERQIINNISGGGIGVSNNILYSMNGLEAYIYAVDLSTEREWDIFPSDWSTYAMNADTTSMNDMSLSDWRKIKDKYVVYYYFNSLTVNKETVLIIGYRFGDENILMLLNSDGKTLVNEKNTSWIVGSSNDRIWTVEVSGDDNVSVHELKITIN